jgi:predicted regulator of Ras-like GTPase activity (Roadblock/LC7/MglB family)
MVSKLEMVLKELTENGAFRASLFSTNAGLVLASQKVDEIDDKIVAAMASLLSDAASAASRDLNLSEMDSMKIKYRDSLVICRNINIGSEDNNFILAVLSKLPESEEVERYFDSLLDWAIENSQEDLRKLGSI